MRILLIHADYLKYHVRDKTKFAEKIEEEMKKGSFDESLVVFTAVEKEDEKNPDGIIDEAVQEIKKIKKKVGAENIVIYPYAHLSSSLASPDAAVDILKSLESKLKSEGLKVSRVPFGWYKSFEISCKGHPLSELSRNIKVKTKKIKEESIESEWFIMDNEELIEIDNYEFKDFEFKDVVYHELGIVKPSEKEPPHIKLMREKKIADYEPSADIGHLRWYPKGKLIRDLLSDYVYSLVTKYGAMVVETPIMYDLSDKAIRVHAEKFGERQYRIHNKKELMLRYACCFGAFKILADSFLRWKDLPVKIYELSTYSFRLEQRGEVVGLKRLRSFTMPDLHTVCRDMQQALEEFEKQVEMCLKAAEDLKLNHKAIFRFTKDFYEENKEWIKSLSRKINEPILIELLPKRKHYWVAKIDFAAVDSLGRPIENSTVQIDVESGERFNISYLDEDGKNKFPVILHCSPTGSIERVICSLLEENAKKINNNKLPMLPVWLSPIHVRVIPVSEKHVDYAIDIVKKINSYGIRADIDDTNETVSKKVRNAGKEWIPYVAVIGDKEISEDKLTVTIRENDEKRELKLEELIEIVKNKLKNKPFKPLTIPYRISQRVEIG